eukprot:scaffold591_cov372-Prasinococcus_capsulatus_cf.AAC.4
MAIRGLAGPSIDKSALAWGTCHYRHHDGEHAPCCLSPTGRPRRRALAVQVLRERPTLENAARVRGRVRAATGRKYS